MKHFMKETASLFLCAAILCGLALAAIEWSLPEGPETPYRTVARALK